MVHPPRRRVGLSRALVTLVVVLAATACGAGDGGVVVPPMTGDAASAPADLPVEVIGLPDDVDFMVADAQPGVENGENLSFVSPVFTLNPAGPIGSSVRVRLRLDNALPSTSPVLVATRTASDQPWAYLPGELTSDQRHVDFETTSFNEVGVLAVDFEGALAGFQEDLRAGLATRIDRAAKKPTCAGEKDAREQGYAVRASKTKTLFWCFGLENGKRVVRVTNRMPIPVEVAHPDVPVLNSPPAAEAWAAWSRALGTDSTVLEPGSTATYDADLEPTTELQLNAESLAPGQSMRLLQAGVRALVLRLTKFGAPPVKIPATVSAFLAMPQCAKSLKTGGDAVAASCFSTPKLVRLFGPSARLVAPLLADPSTPLLLRQQAFGISVAARSTERLSIHVRRVAPDFTAFTALWAGPRRLLSIDATGQVTEMVTDETGARIIDLTYQLEDPETVADLSTASATITAVRLSQRKLVNGRVPRVGDAGTVRVRKGVVTPPFLETRYCSPATNKRGECGS